MKNEDDILKQSSCFLHFPGHHYFSMLEEEISPTLQRGPHFLFFAWSFIVWSCLQTTRISNFHFSYYCSIVWMMIQQKLTISKGNLQTDWLYKGDLIFVSITQCNDQILIKDLAFWLAKKLLIDGKVCNTCGIFMSWALKSKIIQKNYSSDQ